AKSLFLNRLSQTEKNLKYIKNKRPFSASVPSDSPNRQPGIRPRTAQIMIKFQNKQTHFYIFVKIF
ncbi:hypothetical protein, partial [Alistipes finegoldii]|uniref:hypothetical protein n=1 Tax=Alistipes finegoldii TaxID=214856 RepID=UPI0026771265